MRLGLGIARFGPMLGKRSLKEVMMKHPTDHRSSSTGAKLKHFLRLARNRGEAAWEQVRQRGFTRVEGNRRVLEYIRIERGKRV